MNYTKWNEIFKEFYKLETCRDTQGEAIAIPWQTKSRKTGFIYGWDYTWSHFGCVPTEYDDIEWLKIRLDPLNRAIVLKILKAIHVPGEIIDDTVIVYGYRTDIDYL